VVVLVGILEEVIRRSGSDRCAPEHLWDHRAAAGYPATAGAVLLLDLTLLLRDRRDESDGIGGIVVFVVVVLATRRVAARQLAVQITRVVVTALLAAPFFFRCSGGDLRLGERIQHGSEGALEEDAVLQLVPADDDFRLELLEACLHLLRLAHLQRHELLARRERLLVRAVPEGLCLL
jgi:hypothetical protein